MHWWIIASVLVLHVTVTGANEVNNAVDEVSPNTRYYQMYNSVEKYWAYCGQMMWAFNPQEYMCCKGYIRPLLGSRYLSRCCGSLTYNRRTHWCCNGGIRRNYLNSVHAKPRCCGRSSYNPLNQMCCDDIVVAANKETSYSLSACCGRHSYNPFKKTCCSGEVQMLVGGFWYTQCCGSRSINTKREKCCGGVTRYTSDTKNTACCGKILINTKREKCCRVGRKDKISSVWKSCGIFNDVGHFH